MKWIKSSIIQLLLIIFFPTLSMFSQVIEHPLLDHPLIPVADTLPYQVVLEGDGTVPSYSITHLHFIEKATGDTINSFDIKENNPIPLDKVRRIIGDGVPNGSFEWYEVPKELAEEVSDLYRSDLVLDNRGKTVTPLVSSFYIKTWIAPPQSTNSKNTLVFYQTIGYLIGKQFGRQGTAVVGNCGGQTHIVVLNQKGEVLNVLKHIPRPVQDQGYGITSDGKFLGVGTGTDNCDDCFNYVPYEWMVFDVISGEIIMSRRTKFNALFVNGRIKKMYAPNALLLVTSGCESGENIHNSHFFYYQVFDFEKQLVYKSKCELSGYAARISGVELDTYGPHIFLEDGYIERDYTGAQPDRFIRYSEECEVLSLQTYKNQN